MSTFDDWTTVPTGRKLGGSAGAKNLIGTIHNLLPATVEYLKLARRSFPEARERDFTREARDWVDRASGVRYRIARRNPFLLDDPRTSNVAVFVVIDGSLVLLRRSDGGGAEGNRVEFGAVGGRKASSMEPAGIPGDELRIH